MEVSLRCSTRISITSYKTFKFDRSKQCSQILLELNSNFGLTGLKQGAALIYSDDGIEYNFLDMDSPLGKCGVKPNGILIPVLKESKSKIQTTFMGTKEILLDLSIPVLEVLSIIADDMEIYCQPDQYCLYYENDEGTKIPLYSQKSIAEQTGSYQKLYFRRRYFMIFSYQYEDSDNCLHIFRDCLNCYLHSQIKASEDDIVNLAKYIVFAQASSPNIAKTTDVSSIIKTLLPSSIKSTPFLSKKIQTAVKESPDLDKYQAMAEFIKLSKGSKGFGEELYHCTLTDSKTKNKKIDLYCTIHGLRLTEKGTMNLIYNIPTINIKEMQHLNAKYLKIKFNIGDTKEITTATFTFKENKSICVYTYLNEELRLLKQYAQTKKQLTSRQRRNKLSQMQRNMIIKTVDEANKKVKQFLEDEAKEIKSDLLLERVRITTDPKLLERDDFQSFNELAQVDAIIRDDYEFAKRLRSYLPDDNLTLYDLKGTIERLKSLQNSLSTQANNKFKMTIKDASFTVQCALFYVNAIKDGFHYTNIDNEINTISKPIQALFVVVKNSEAMQLGISDIRDQVISGFQMIIDSIPVVIARIDQMLKTLPKQKKVSIEKLTSLPRGSILLSAITESTYRLMQYIFTVRLELLNYEVDISKLFPALSKFAIFAYNFYQQLKAGTCNIKENLNGMSAIFREIAPYLGMAYDSPKVSDEFLARFQKNFKKVLNLSWLAINCFAEKGETVGIKLFPGTLYLRHKALDAFQDTETFITQLQQMPDFQQDKQLNNYFTETVRACESAISICLKLMNELLKRPTNEVLRMAIMQSISSTRKSILKVRDRFLQYGERLPVQYFQIIQGHLDNIDNFLFSLSPMNISIQRIEACSESLSALADEMRSQNIDQVWVEHLQNTLEKFNEWCPKLIENPTDGATLFLVHKQLHATTRDIKTLEAYLGQLNLETIPIIIEVMLPTIIKTLANPELNDEPDQCQHLSFLCQVHMNVARLITFITNILLAPQISVLDNLVSRTKTQLDLLKKEYVKLTHMRPYFMQNPYMYTEYLKLSKVLDEMKVISAK